MGVKGLIETIQGYKYSVQILSVSRLSSHQVTKTPLISHNWLDFTNELKREVDLEMTNFQKEK